MTWEADPNAARLEIEDSIMRCRGVMADVARDLCICRKQLYRWVERMPELWEVIDRARDERHAGDPLLAAARRALSGSAS